eukprot:scaffold14647_cov124-Isochrysis_galbana.AAC.1
MPLLIYPRVCLQRTSGGDSVPSGKRMISGPTSFRNSSSRPPRGTPPAARGATLSVALTVSSLRSASTRNAAATSTAKSPLSASPGAISTAISGAIS